MVQLAMDWPDILKFKGTVDGASRLAFVVLFGALLAVNGLMFESSYGDRLITLYTMPWWRILVVAVVVAASLWCPRVGVIVAAVAFFYLADMETLITPFAPTVTKVETSVGV